MDTVKAIRVGGRRVFIIILNEEVKSEKVQI